MPGVLSGQASAGDDLLLTLETESPLPQSVLLSAHCMTGTDCQMLHHRHGRPATSLDTTHDRQQLSTAQMRT